MILLEKISIEERNKTYADILTPYKDDPNVFITFTSDVGAASHLTTYNTPKVSYMDKIIIKIQQVLKAHDFADGENNIIQASDGQIFDQNYNPIGSVSEVLSQLNEEELAEEFAKNSKFQNAKTHYDSVVGSIRAFLALKGISAYGTMGYSRDAVTGALLPSPTFYSDFNEKNLRKFTTILAKFPEAKHLLNQYTTAYGLVKAHKHGSNMKLGLNPKSNFNTPNGIYSYPVKSLWNDISRNYVPYQGGAPFIWVFKPKNPEKILRRLGDDRSYTEKSFLQDYEKLREALGDEFMREPYRLGVDENFGWTNDNPGRKLWALTKNVAEILALKDSGKIQFKWPLVLAACGYEGVVDDTGKGIIHTNEPTQGVFWLRNYIEPITLINNRYIQKRATLQSTTSIAGKVQNLWSKIKSSKKGKFKLPESFIDKMYSSEGNHHELMSILYDILIDKDALDNKNINKSQIDIPQIENTILSSPYSMPSDYALLTILNSKYRDNPPKKYTALITGMSSLIFEILHAKWDDMNMVPPEWVIKQAINSPEYIVNHFGTLYDIYPDIIDNFIISTSANIDYSYNIFSIYDQTYEKLAKKNPNMVLFLLKYFYQLSHTEGAMDWFLSAADQVVKKTPELLQNPKFKQFFDYVNLDLYKFGTLGSYIQWYGKTQSSTVKKRIFKKIKETLTAHNDGYDGPTWQEMVSMGAIQCIDFLGKFSIKELINTLGEKNIVKYLLRISYLVDTTLFIKLLKSIVDNMETFSDETMPDIIHLLIKNKSQLILRNIMTDEEFWNLISNNSQISPQSMDLILHELANKFSDGSITASHLIDVLLTLKHNSDNDINFYELMIGRVKNVDQAVELFEYLKNMGLIDISNIDVVPLIIRLIQASNFFFEESINKFKNIPLEKDKIDRVINKTTTWSAGNHQLESVLYYILNIIPEEYVLENLNVFYNTILDQSELKVDKKILPYIPKLNANAQRVFFETLNFSKIPMTFKKELYKLDKEKYLNLVKKFAMGTSAFIKPTRYTAEEAEELLGTSSYANREKLRRIFGSPSVIPPGNPFWDLITTNPTAAKFYLNLLEKPLSAKQSQFLNPIVLFLLSLPIQKIKEEDVLLLISRLQKLRLILNKPALTKLNQVVNWFLNSIPSEKLPVRLQHDFEWGNMISKLLSLSRYLTNSTSIALISKIDLSDYLTTTQSAHILGLAFLKKSPSKELQQRIISMIPNMITCYKLQAALIEHLDTYQSWPNVPLIYSHMAETCEGDLESLIKDYGDEDYPYSKGFSELTSHHEKTMRFKTELNLKTVSIAEQEIPNINPGMYIFCKKKTSKYSTGSVFRIIDRTSYGEFQITGYLPMTTGQFTGWITPSILTKHFDLISSGNPGKLFKEYDKLHDEDIKI